MISIRHCTIKPSDFWKRERQQDLGQIDIQTPERPEEKEKTMENREFFIDKDGFKLHAKLDFPEGNAEKMPLVILSHGLTGHMEERHIVAAAKAITQSGYACLRVELYGHGQSDGKFENHNVAEWVLELLYIVDYARQLDFVTDIYLSGHSQGGLAVILAAGMKADMIKGLIPLAPAIVIVDACKDGSFFGQAHDITQIPEELHLWPDKFVTGNYIRTGRLLPVDAMIDAYKGPVLIIHGTEDEAVPYRYATDAAAKYENCELVTIEGDDHCYDYHLDQVTDALKKWLTAQKA